MKVIFELIKSFEFDISSNDEKIKGRIELFRSLENPESFRYKTYETEIFQLIPTFPKDNKEQPTHNSDEMLLVERTFPSGNKLEKEFMARNENEAINFVLSKIEAFYCHVLI